jgi:hypothetical protein
LFNFNLEFLKGVQSFKALIAKIVLITNTGLGSRQVLMSPNSDPNRINVGSTADFVKKSALSPSELLKVSNAMLRRIFSLDSRTLSKFSTAASYYSKPTSKSYW